MTEKSITPTQAEQYILTVRLSTDGFSFSVYDPQKKVYRLFRQVPVNSQRSMAANVKGFLADTPELGFHYGQTNILFHTLRYTTVPLELFEDEQMEIFFYQNLPERDNEIILCNVLGKSNVTILFAIDKLTHLFLSEHFPHARFFSTASPLVEYFTRLGKQANTPRVYACLHPADTEIFCMDRETLRLANTYATGNNDDRAYYLLNIWKQLGYDPEHDELHLTGLPEDERNKLVAFLRQFIRKIFVINPRTEYNTASVYPIEAIPFDIQSLLICE